MKSPPWEDKYFCRIKLENIIDVPAGSNLDLTVWIAKDMANHTSVTTYSGNSGD